MRPEGFLTPDSWNDEAKSFWLGKATMESLFQGVSLGIRNYTWFSNRTNINHLQYVCCGCRKLNFVFLLTPVSVRQSGCFSLPSAPMTDVVCFYFVSEFQNHFCLLKLQRFVQFNRIRNLGFYRMLIFASSAVEWAKQKSIQRDCQSIKSAWNFICWSPLNMQYMQLGFWRGSLLGICIY